MRVNDGWRKLVLVAIENEKPEHLALKLAAYLSFWDLDLTMEASGKHPALAGVSFRPDLMNTNIEGQVGTWIECGNTTLNKLAKVRRKWPEAKMAVFKDTEQKALKFREDMRKEVPRSHTVEIYTWKERGFQEWLGLMSEKTEVYGEVGGTDFNLVVNEAVYTTDLVRV